MQDKEMDYNIRKSLDRILKKHNNTREYDSVSLLVMKFEEMYLHSIDKLGVNDLRMLKKQLYLNFQVVHYESLITNINILLQAIRKNLNEI